MENRLYEFTLKLRKGAATEGDALLPAARNDGAYVTCYTGAPDPLSAIRRGIAAARERNYAFIDLLGNVREIPLSSWSDYIERTWPEHSGTLPAANRLPQYVIEGTAFFGPFTAFATPPRPGRASADRGFD